MEFTSAVKMSSYEIHLRSALFLGHCTPDPGKAITYKRFSAGNVLLRSEKLRKVSMDTMITRLAGSHEMPQTCP